MESVMPTPHRGGRDDERPVRRSPAEAGRHASASEHHDMPSQISGDLGFFDRFADTASHFASRAPFFAACVLLVLVWAPTIFVIGDVDTWQLIINTATTIVTFLLVALLQNSQYRSDEAVQHKLNAIAQALAHLMDHAGEADLRDQVVELTDAVGLERRESS
jgi:low affinity Fe/Cu permease